MPIHVGIMIPTGAKVRLLNEILEELSYAALYARYSRKGRNLAAEPKLLFKIVAYAYMEGTYSSRAIARACRRDIHFMWLLGGAKPPSHQTIARFRSERLKPVIEDLFYQLVKKLYEKGEIGYREVFVDGTKIEANANKYSFVWKKGETKQSVRLENKLAEFMGYASAKYGYRGEDAEELYDFLDERAREESVEFVHGRGRHKSQLQRDYETLGGYLERRARYAEHREIFGTRNSFSKTDVDATFMHMKEDHMRNSQLKPGYNLQLGVEGGYIVGMDISSERSDAGTLIPLLKRMESNLGARHEKVVADAGYESEENYAYLKGTGQMSFIKPSNYERQKKRAYKTDLSLRENMPYDEQKDEYTCKNGKTLRSKGTAKRKSRSGYEAKLTVYESESCQGCGYKEQCTKAKGPRQMRISKAFLAYRKQSYANIVSAEGIDLRINRSIQSEGTFGVLKEDYGFRRFMLRSEGKVRTETLLYCMAFNLNRLYRKTKNNRLGYWFYEKMIS